MKSLQVDNGLFQKATKCSLDTEKKFTSSTKKLTHNSHIIYSYSKANMFASNLAEVF